MHRITKYYQKFFQVLFDLTVNHIRYGVKSEYLSPFGQALLFTLEEVVCTTCYEMVKIVSQVLKPSWSPETESMWKEV
eukprot:767111-Hanusia_phi.AAC.1